MTATGGRAEWSRRLDAIRIPDARVARLLGQPLKNARIAALRATSGTVPVAARTFWGDDFHGVLPEAVSALVWRFGMYEKATSQFLLRYLPEGGCMVDIGAHFGYFSLLAARLVGPAGRVVAIEAMPATFAFLQANLAANAAGNVTALNVAAADAPQTLTFRDFGVVHSSLNSSGIVRGVLAGRDVAAVEVAVPAHPADALLAGAGASRPDIVKIDAESSEEQVLDGMAGMLGAAQPPMVLIELGGGDAEEDRRSHAIVARMQALGFDACLFRERALRRTRFDGRFPYANIVFVPAGDDRISPEPAITLSGSGAFA